MDHQRPSKEEIHDLITETHRPLTAADYDRADPELLAILDECCRERDRDEPGRADNEAILGEIQGEIRRRGLDREAVPSAVSPGLR